MSDYTREQLIDLQMKLEEQLYELGMYIEETKYIGKKKWKVVDKMLSDLYSTSAAMKDELY